MEKHHRCPLNPAGLLIIMRKNEAQIRVFCQQYTSHSTAKIKAAVQELGVDIMRMEKGLPRYSGASVGPLLHEKMLELSSLLQE